MFGTNAIIGKKYFKETPVDSLFVTSMFFTLQGEGPYAGLPAVFIRLTKCNLTCSFCDTFFDDGEWMTFEQIEANHTYGLLPDDYYGYFSPLPEYLRADLVPNAFVSIAYA